MTHASAPVYKSADPVVIVAAVRTAMGRPLGNLSSLPAPQLAAHAMREALARSGLAADALDEVLLGCVLSAGQGQAPARQAMRAAGISDATGATTINKVCGSGMKATMLAQSLLLSGEANIVMAGGMESMSNAPYLLARARSGYRAGHDRLLDHMMLDGLEDAYEQGRPMGDFGEAAASKYGFTRSDQDAYAIKTLTRARQAVSSGAFLSEIVPITITGRNGTETLVDTDELPMSVSPDKIPRLKPAFRADGTITAASSSANADGAAALILTRRSVAKAWSLPILAEIRATASAAQEPAWFTTAPIPAITRLLERSGWQIGDVDLFEINEAFAVVAMAAAAELGIPEDRLNVNGGACALGHPIGATGARLIVTLLHALQKRGLKRGIASLCIGGGEATAIAIELPS